MRAWSLAAMLVLSITQATAQVLIDKGRELEVPVCGGFAGFVCRGNQWCDFPPGAACGIGDVFGSCRARPEICTREFMPVCACNGQTYGNACQAAAAGFDVAYPGACRSEAPRL